MKKTLVVLSLLMGVQSQAAQLCSNGQSTDNCKCNSGYTAKCEYNGGPFCQNNSPTGSDADCGGKTTISGVTSSFTIGKTTVVKKQVQSVESVAPLQLKK
jgi:hypothetical protein